MLLLLLLWCSGIANGEMRVVVAVDSSDIYRPRMTVLSTLHYLAASVCSPQLPPSPAVPVANSVFGQLIFTRMHFEHFFDICTRFGVFFLATALKLLLF